MEILEPHNEQGWITAIICGRWCQAKVYDLPSFHGVNGGRVSKLVIGKTDTLNPDMPFFPQIDYNYSRGLDFDTLPDGILDSVLEQLEALPCLESAD